MSIDPILLVEITGYTDAGVSQVYRFSTGEYCTLDTDTPANARYDDCVSEAGYIERRLFEDGKSGVRSSGQGSVGVGAARLKNVDGHLDAVFGSAAISFREREYRVLEVQPGASYSTAQLVLRASVSQTSMDRREVTIGLKDRAYELDSDHLTVTYAGNNVLPAGIEGTAELAGKVKPLIMGKCLGVSPYCVNTSKLIYQVSTASIVSALVYDGGSLVTAGADYANQADMEATAPSAGQVRWWKAGGCFRAGTAPTFQFTADVTADSAADSTAAQLIKRLVLARGWTLADIDTAAVTALDALNSAVCGLNIPADGAKTTQLMSRAAASVGAVWTADDLGVLDVERFSPPAGSVDDPTLLLIGEHNCDEVTKITDGEDVPTLDVRLKYARYYAPLKTGETAGSLTQAQRSDLGEEWRVARYTGTISPNPHRRTQIAERETALVTKADADAEALRQFNQHSVPRRSHRLRCSGDQVYRLARLNGVIGLYWDRQGFNESTATLRRVVAITKRLSFPRRVEMTVWGS
jgi:hypothetical protein